MTHESRDEDVGVGVQDSGLEREVQNGLGPDLVVRQKNQVLQVRSRLQATQGHPTAKKRVNEVKKAPDVGGPGSADAIAGAKRKREK